MLLEGSKKLSITQSINRKLLPRYLLLVQNFIAKEYPVEETIREQDINLWNGAHVNVEPGLSKQQLLNRLLNFVDSASFPLTTDKPSVFPITLPRVLAMLEGFISEPQPNVALKQLELLARAEEELNPIRAKNLNQLRKTLSNLSRSK